MPGSLFETAAAVVEDASFAVKRLVLGRHRTRRTRVYCIGAPKSGTHSIAEMFSKQVRARHEPGSKALLRRLLARHHGTLTEEEFREWLRRRDRELGLEVDSASLNYFFLDFLLSEFPEARFILTLRDCYSSANSQINQFFRFVETRNPIWTEFRNARLGPAAFQYEPEEQVLRELNVPNLETHFSGWSNRINDILRRVPPERLLIVKTPEIKARAQEIAAFAGLPARMIRLGRAHAYSNPVKRYVLREIDRAFLERKADKYCRPLMSRFFPGIKSLDDAVL